MGRTAIYEAGYSRKTGVEHGTYAAADAMICRTMMDRPKGPGAFSKARIARLIKTGFLVVGLDGKITTTKRGDCLALTFAETPFRSLTTRKKGTIK